MDYIQDEILKNENTNNTKIVTSWEDNRNRTPADIEVNPNITKTVEITVSDIESNSTPVKKDKYEFTSVYTEGLVDTLTGLQKKKFYHKLSQLKKCQPRMDSEKMETKAYQTALLGIK